MAQVTFSPPFTAPSDVASQLRQAGYAVLSPADVARWVGCDLSALMALNGDWAALPPDDFLKDGGRYRWLRWPGCPMPCLLRPRRPCPGSSRRTSSASTPPTALAGPRLRGRTVMAWTWWPSSWWGARASRAARRACSRPQARAASALH